MKRLSLSDFFSLLASNAVNMPGLIWNNFAVPGLIWNNFGYGQCAARIGPDHVICLIWLLDVLVRAWPNSCGLKASRCAGIIRPSYWQDATGLLPVSHCQTRVHSSTDILDRIVQNLNQPRTSLVLAGWLSSFCQTDLVRKRAGVQESSGPLPSQSKPDPACLLGRFFLISPQCWSNIPYIVSKWNLACSFVTKNGPVEGSLCVNVVKWAVICPVMYMITCTCRLVIIRRHFQFYCQFNCSIGVDSAVKLTLKSLPV